MTAITTTWMKNKDDYEFDDCNPNHNIAFDNKGTKDGDHCSLGPG